MKKKNGFVIHSCKLMRLFFSLQQIRNDSSYRHSFEMIVFLSEKPAEGRLQTDLGFSNKGANRNT